MFNAKIISAPISRDFFGRDTNPAAGAPPGMTYPELVRKAAQVAKPMGDAPNRLLMSFKPMAEHEFSLNSAAESRQAVVNFLNGAFCFKAR